MNKDLSSFCQPLNDPSYEAQLLHFSKLRSAPAFLLFDVHQIGKQESLEILFAMLHKRPIIITDTPSFLRDVELFSRQLVATKLSKIYLCDLRKLDDTDFESFVSNVINKPVNYVITKHEAELIKTRLRTHFRELLKN